MFPPPARFVCGSRHRVNVTKILSAEIGNLGDLVAVNGSLRCSSFHVLGRPLRDQYRRSSLRAEGGIRGERGGTGASAPGKGGRSHLPPASTAGTIEYPSKNSGCLKDTRLTVFCKPALSHRQISPEMGRGVAYHLRGLP